MEANLLIVNGKCLSMDKDLVYNWIAIKNNHIMALGKGETYKNIIICDNVIDAKQCTVLPGFIDCHFHMVQTALNRRSVDLSEAKDFNDIADLIRTEGLKNPGMHINGIRIDKNNLKEKRLPTRHEIDKFWNNSSVWLNSYDYVTSSLNTYGLLYYKIPFTLEGVELDEKNMPTGIFRGKANNVLRANILDAISDFYKYEALTNLMPELASQGLTTANVMEGGKVYSDKDAQFIYNIINEKKVYLDMELFFQTMNLEKIHRMNLKRVGGCLYIDGTFNSRNAALSFEYADSQGHYGRLYFTKERLDEFVEECYERDLQLAVYAIGDRAIDMALNSFERATELTGKFNLRNRIEHVELPTEEHIKKAKKLGVIFSMQPNYEDKWGRPGGMYNQRLGEMYTKTNPFRKILDGDVKICGGSDSDTTEINYIKSIYNATNHPIAEHSISTMEAIRMFTSDAAFAIKKEKEKGYLKEGYLADIAILNGDILDLDKDANDLKVNVTIKSGKVVYKNGSFLDVED